MTTSEVMLLRWPEDAEDGPRLARQGVAVLYLIDGFGDPPDIGSCLEDWVRVPGDERDLRARIAALEARSHAHLAPPRLDADGLLRYRGQVTMLSADNRDLARALVNRFGNTVPDDELPAADTAALRLRIAQLRSQVRGIGLSIHRVRLHGYKMQGR